MAEYIAGAWVADFALADRPRIGRIKDAYGTAGDLLLDVVIYSKDGERLGRVSPACGGPRGFEPACPAEVWTLIEAPDFNYLAQARYGWGDRVRRIAVDAPCAVAPRAEGIA